MPMIYERECYAIRGVIFPSMRRNSSTTLRPRPSNLDFLSTSGHFLKSTFAQEPAGLTLSRKLLRRNIETHESGFADIETTRPAFNVRAADFTAFNVDLILKGENIENH